MAFFGFVDMRQDLLLAVTLGRDCTKLAPSRESTRARPREQSEGARDHGGGGKGGQGAVWLGRGARRGGHPLLSVYVIELF
eukprot:scaffold17276_cov36-Tisochrysis_lutea.AAC.4